MCGRYTLVSGKAKLITRFGVQGKPAGEIKPNYNIAPGQTMPVITNSGKGNQLELMRWGLIPVWAKDPAIGYKMINARAETLAEKPTWKRPFKSQRCLVPASGFYEWRRDGSTKTPYYIHLTGEDTFAFAGLYDEWTDKSSGEVIRSYSIITTNPNGVVKPIHDRMPVILEPSQEDDWLSPKSNDDIGFLEHLLKPYSDKSMDAYTVSTEVNSAKHNSAELIEQSK